MSNVDAVVNTPLQIYYSALVFAPSRSLVRRQFLHLLPPCIGCLPDVPAGWSGKELTITDHAHAIEVLVSHRTVGRLQSVAVMR